MSVPRKPLESCAAYFCVSHPDFSECQVEKTDHSPVALSPCLTLILLSVLPVSGLQGLASHRSALPPTLLSDFYPSCPMGERSSTGIYSRGYGVCIQAGKWLWTIYVYTVCVCG